MSLPVKRDSGELDVYTKEMVNQQTAKILDIIPDVVDQYKHDIDISGKLLKHIDGDNLVNPSPVLKDPRSVIDFLKRTDLIKIQILKAAGIIAPVAANVRVQQFYSQNNTNILGNDIIQALGGALSFDEDSTNPEIVTLDDTEDIIDVENTG